MKLKIGLAFCGSFCTYDRVLDVFEKLRGEYDITPIMSEISADTDTRYGDAAGFKKRLIEITGNQIIETITDAEPIGPEKLFDLLVIAPCTGNTLAKLANGIADTCVTMAAKAHLRNGRPVVIGVSTNDGLSGNAANLGALLNRRNYYFIPFGQDDAFGKPCSLVAHYERAGETIEAAAQGKQIQPLLEYSAA